jgi:hypothetical protein
MKLYSDPKQGRLALVDLPGDGLGPLLPTVALPGQSASRSRSSAVIASSPSDVMGIMWRAARVASCATPSALN